MLVNSNPVCGCCGPSNSSSQAESISHPDGLQATIMTDPGTADRTYIGPMTPELVEEIIAKAGHASELRHSAYMGRDRNWQRERERDVRARLHQGCRSMCRQTARAVELRGTSEPPLWLCRSGQMQCCRLWAARQGSTWPRALPRCGMSWNEHGRARDEQRVGVAQQSSRQRQRVRQHQPYPSRRLVAAHTLLICWAESRSRSLLNAVCLADRVLPRRRASWTSTAAS